ncbi:MAG: rhomboid family intramembrane serine protease [Bacteroidia bacterium]
MSVVDDLKHVFTRSGNGLMRIILINVIIFFAVNIADQFIKFTGSGRSLVYWLALPGDVVLALAHCWTFITYMFLHEGLMHILFNMLWLYWLGNIFVEYVGSKRLVGVYLLGGISGGILYALTSLIFPLYFYNTFLLGASAGVMAVVIAIAILLPDYIIHLMFFGGVKLKYLALASFILTTILDFSQNTGGKIAHIGGAFLGMVFMLQYKNGKDITKPVTAFLDWISSLFSGRSKIKVSYRRKTSDDEYNASQKAKQQKVDMILDKISKSGYEALTKEEKDFLFKASGKN